MSKGTRITKRWIDADGIMRACYNSFLTTGNKAYSEIIALVEAVPAADVVEVVRCRECKHREYDDFMKELVCDLDAADPYERSRCAEDDEWFCKDGEREDG